MYLKTYPNYLSSDGFPTKQSFFQHGSQRLFPINHLIIQITQAFYLLEFDIPEKLKSEENQQAIE